ncbi:hypothetical protein FXV77_02640 [Sphingobacterium phlebotomi]|uniref:Uncharacterized protein n=1 Tax=Sphingobacterium phlebotomi TaxID=2605433 RepID=A0A5D4HBL5_9SPHI|nr:hypothetical protein [Sphingobacterium phlebotomi]TYR38196.1 hypothetical protein FXV77_02640 [Sphingobacterium phlebotomi]
MLKILSSFLLFCSVAHVTAQTTETSTQDDIKRIKDFIADVADETLRPDIILSRHVLLEQTETDEEYDYLEASIEEIRINLQPKNLDEIAYIPFQELPKRGTRDIDPEGKPTAKMYFLHYRKRQMLAVYIAQDKIASFTLVSKGDNQAHFVTY